MSKNFKAYEKLDHTVCLNSQNLKLGIDTDEHVDCNNNDELIYCLDTIGQVVKAFDKGAHSHVRINNEKEYDETITLKMYTTPALELIDNNPKILMVDDASTTLSNPNIVILAYYIE